MLFGMLRLPPRWTRTDTLCPYTPLFRSDVLGELGAVEVGVEAALAEQVGVGALLDDPAVLDDQDQVGVAHGREPVGDDERRRSEEHTSELQSLMIISYAVFFLQKLKVIAQNINTYIIQISNSSHLH